MYNPHLLECGACLTPFVDGQLVFHHYEDYLCVPCTPLHVQETAGSHIWREKPEVNISTN